MRRTTRPFTHRFVLLYLVLACGLSVIAPSAGLACPPNTVFSAHNGRGLCLEPGQGLKPVAECFVKKQGNCPADFVTKHKASDPDHDFCCPTERRNIKACVRTCGPLLEMADKEEGKRVYKNCVIGCRFGEQPRLTCPDGRLLYGKNVSCY